MHGWRFWKVTNTLAYSVVTAVTETYFFQQWLQSPSVCIIKHITAVISCLSLSATSISIQTFVDMAWACPSGAPHGTPPKGRLLAFYFPVSIRRRNYGRKKFYSTSPKYFFVTCPWGQNLNKNFFRKLLNFISIQMNLVKTFIRFFRKRPS